MAAKKKSKSTAEGTRARSGRPERDARLHLRMPSDLLAQIEKIAAADDRTAASLVVRVMTEWVANRPK